MENMVYYVDVMAGRPPTKDAPPFGKRLAAARKGKGWSQAELARRLNATRALIDYYERRAKNPTMDFVQRVADVLDVSVTELVNGEGKELRKRPGPVSKMEKQIEELRRLPRTKQRFVSELLDTVLKTAD
jgi:transcriptional regulator with XRE-family HTH domain